MIISFNWGKISPKVLECKSVYLAKPFIWDQKRFTGGWGWKVTLVSVFVYFQRSKIKMDKELDNLNTSLGTTWYISTCFSSPSLVMLSHLTNAFYTIDRKWGVLVQFSGTYKIYYLAIWICTQVWFGDTIQISKVL